MPIYLPKGWFKVVNFLNKNIFQAKVWKQKHIVHENILEKKYANRKQILLMFYNNDVPTTDYGYSR